MKLVTYRAFVEAPASLGVLIDDMVVDVAELGEFCGLDLPGVDQAQHLSLIHISEPTRPY